MVSALKNEELKFSLKCITVEPDIISTKNLKDLVSNNMFRFFRIFGVSSEFLDGNLEIWEEDQNYKKSIKKNYSFYESINDITERGVELMEEYNKIHINNGKQKQFLLLIIKQFRQKYHDVKKSTSSN